ncbi:hypothetical protein AMATHDRAFT_138498, partial [Amanita thiersii Skay4041]
QLPQRRLVSQRTKVDENANVRHTRQSSITSAARFPGKENANKVLPARTALGEVTLATVNRKDSTAKNVTGKDKEEIGLKRGRSNSTTLTQRVPLGPGRTQVSQPAQPITNNVHARAPVGRHRVHASNTHRRHSRIPVPEPVVVHEEEDEQEEPKREIETVTNVVDQEREVETMVDVEEAEVEQAVQPPLENKAPKIWPQMDTQLLDRCQKEVQAVREHFTDDVNVYDTTMVSEYADDIFQYMSELEEKVMADPNYMDGQTEINWGMRQTLIDWLLQVHLRYHMLPETLWIAVNIVDRFLTKRVISVNKFQLVGVTAMFIAAKYEEILAPSVDEFVFMTENGFTRDEILKGERIILQTLDFQISHYCSPYSWMRKISKADDYELQTRTLSKFLTEVTLLDHRFLRAKPSLIAAVGMFSARKMLGGDWNDAFVYHSGYTAEQLTMGHQWLMGKLLETGFTKTYVCKKYANKKFLKASVFAIDFARGNMRQEFPTDLVTL